MDTLKTVAISALVVVVGLVGVQFFHPGSATAPSFGALSGPDIASSYLKWGLGNGVRVYPTGRALSTATTTVCAIQSPNATSTLRWAGVRFDVSSTTASVVTIAKSATAFATTTSIGTDYNIAANGQGFIQASTSPAAGAVTVFAPNTWLVVGMKGGTGTFSPTGACQATFEEFPTI